MPISDSEAAELHDCLQECTTGLLPNGWGEVSKWPADRIKSGDWSAAVWRSPQLAVEASQIANDGRLLHLRDQGMMPADTGRLLRGRFKASTPGTLGSFPILKSKGAEGQTRIQSIPDEHWIPKEGITLDGLTEDQEQEHPETKRLMLKAGYLLVTAGQRCTSRLTAVAGDEKHVGNGWMPISGMTPKRAKAAAVFLNSTVGRLQLMRNPGRTLEFPTYSAQEVANLRAPDLDNERICTILADCWQRTAQMVVPQFRDGECKVRQLWDEAVASALKLDPDKLVELRQLLHREPHVRGLGRNQFG